MEKAGSFIIGCLLFLVSCGDNDTSQPNAARILSEPPFESITDSIQRFPDNVQLLLQRAVMLAQKNYHEIATADFQKAWELTGDENIGLEYAANLLLTGNEHKAQRFLEEGSKLFPLNTEYKRRLAEVYRQVGDTRKAIMLYDSLLYTDSENFEAWYDKGLLQAQTGDTAGAIESLEKSYALMPLNHSGLALAQMLIARKDNRVLEICDYIISRDSTARVDATFLKGVYYSESGQLQSAIQQFNEVIRLDWKMTDAYIEKGIVYLQLKDHKQALETFSMATTVSNTNADAWYWLGRTYEAMGNNEEAARNYERTISLEPDFAEAKQRLRKLQAST